MSLRESIKAAVSIVAIVAIAGLYMAYRYERARRVKVQTESVRQAARISELVKEAKRVEKIAAVGKVQTVVDAGAAVTAKVEARVETASEAGGDATVEVQPGEPEQPARGTLVLDDEHERFKARADWEYSDTLHVSNLHWSARQVFRIETIQFSQRREGETLWQGYSVTLAEASPKTGEEIGRWTVPYEQIDAEYVASGARRRWAIFTAAGFTWGMVNDNPGFYGEAGLRVRNFEAAFGATDEDLVGRVGWRREW